MLLTQPSVPQLARAPLKYRHNGRKSKAVTVTSPAVGAAGGPVTGPDRTRVQRVLSYLPGKSIFNSNPEHLGDDGVRADL